MKNVRLFALAASIGMFTSTVMASEAKTTVSWGKHEEIIKIDLGEKLIVKAPTATVSIESLSEICQNGNDKNGDGFVDSEFLAMLPSNNTGWLYTNAKFFPTEKTAMYYLGLGGGSITASSLSKFL